MRFLDNQLDVGARLRYSKGNGENLNDHTYATLDQAMWPKYKVYDLFASYWMTPQINLSMALENATDEAYFVAMGDVNNLSLARGRTLTGMLEYKFRFPRALTGHGQPFCPSGQKRRQEPSSNHQNVQRNSYEPFRYLRCRLRQLHRRPVPVGVGHRFLHRRSWQ